MGVISFVLSAPQFPGNAGGGVFTTEVGEVAVRAATPELEPLFLPGSAEAAAPVLAARHAMATHGITTRGTARMTSDGLERRRASPADSSTSSRAGGADAPQATDTDSAGRAASRAIRDATAGPLLLGAIFAAGVIAVGGGGRPLRFAIAALLLLAGGIAASGLRQEVAGLAAEYEKVLEQRSRMRERAEGACRSRDALLRAIGRDLRASLNSILGWTALLHRCADDPATVRRGTETIDRSARAQARLADELETFPRLRSSAPEAPRISSPTLDARGPRPPS
jgi:signal transduction histidine kinase